MIPEETLRRYIKDFDKVIEAKDNLEAKKLQENLIALYEDDFKNLKKSLTNQTVNLFENGELIEDIEGRINAIKDAELIREYLIIELEKYEGEKSLKDDEKPHKIFISHSSRDTEYVRAFVELLETFGLSEEEIICSSVPPYGIPLGKNVYEWLVNEFQYSDLHVIYVFSDNYYSSVASLNEMGAAWAMKHEWTGLLLPEFSFDKLGGCIDKNQVSIKLDDTDKNTLKYRLGEFKTKIIEEFNLKPKDEAVWERQRDEFLKKINSITAAGQFCKDMA